MQDFSDVKLDIPNMTLEEMKETRDNIYEHNYHATMRKIAGHKHFPVPGPSKKSRNNETSDALNHHIVMRKIAAHKYCSK